MPKNTDNYKLYEVVAETDGANTFNFDVMLNDNWDIIDAELAKKASLDESGKLASSMIPDIDCGIWDNDPIAQHNASAMAHQNMVIDGNNTAGADGSETLEAHMINSLAHQNMVIDGNNN